MQVFGEVQLSFLVAGAVIGEVEVSLFVAGAVFREIWNDSRSAKCCIFHVIVVSVKSNLGCEAGCGLTGSFSDHGRIMLGRSQLFSSNFCHILDGHFAWQAQYLVWLDNDTCCSAHCK